MESASLCSKSKARFISGQINSTTVHSAPTQFGADFTVFIRLDLAVAALFGVELRFGTRSHLGALLLLATTVLVDIAGKNRRCRCFFLGGLCSGRARRFRFGFRFFYRCFRLFCRFFRLFLYCRRLLLRSGRFRLPIRMRYFLCQAIISLCRCGFCIHIR